MSNLFSFGKTNNINSFYVNFYAYQYIKVRSGNDLKRDFYWNEIYFTNLQSALIKNDF